MSEGRPATGGVDSPLGPLTLIADRGQLRELRFARAEAGGGYSAVIGEAVRQLGEYFAGRRHAFDLALAPEGTDFQRAVWAVLERVAWGRTISYGELALAVGCPRGARAAAQAVAANPIPIIIPCHRVIRSDGGVGGYSGGTERKLALLAHEGVHLP